MFSVIQLLSAQISLVVFVALDLMARHWGLGDGKTMRLTESIFPDRAPTLKLRRNRA